MRSGLAFRGRLRGDLGAVGQEIDLLAQDDTGWRESEHDSDGAHTDITADTLDVAGLTKFGGPWRMAGSAVNTPRGGEDITADQNNYNPRDLDDAIWLRLSTDATRTITGIVTNKDEFRHLIVTNIGNYNIVLAHNSSSSLAIYRIGNPASTDVTVGPNASAWLAYDAHAGNWRLIGLAGSAVSAGYWSVLTNGDRYAPELIVDGSGDVISVWETA